jgi:glutathione S-transferase
MDFVAIVIALALVEYIVFSMLVGKARVQYKVDAPATTGDPKFDCYFRVQQNTLEQLIIFIPGIMLFARYVNADVAAGLGVVYIIGRIIYFKSYVTDPGKRGIGFILSFFPSIILVLGGLIGAIMKVM